MASSFFTLSISRFLHSLSKRNKMRSFPPFFSFSSFSRCTSLLLSLLSRAASFDSIASKLVSIRVDTRDRTRARTVFPATDADIFLRISRRGTVDFARISFVNKKQDTWLSAVQDGIYDRLHDHLSLGDNTCPLLASLFTFTVLLFSYIYTDES